MPRFFRRVSEGVFDEQDLRRRADELAEFVLAASAAYGIEDRSLVAVGLQTAPTSARQCCCAPGLLAGAAAGRHGLAAEPPDVDSPDPVIISTATATR